MNDPQSRTPEEAFPRLEVLPLREIRFHEEVDPGRVAALVERLGGDGVLKHPPIVAPVSGGRHLLLDGANRIEALSRMEIPHALVQIERLEDPDLRLSHWNHVIRASAVRELLGSPPAGVRLLAGEGGAERGRPICRLIRPDGRETLFFAPDRPAARTAALRGIGSCCANPRARMARIAHADLERARRAHPEFGGVLEYEGVGKDQVRAMAEAGERLPAGITRFLVPRRVLGFRLPLSFLDLDLPLVEKRRRLEALVSERFDAGRVRYYAEPTFVFDD